MKTPAKWALACCCLATLTACYGGPTDSEVEDAMKARVNDMAEDAGSPRVTSAKNVRCRSVESGAAYMCAVEVEMSVPGRQGKSETELKMVKVDGAWTYDRNATLSMQFGD